MLQELDQYLVVPQKNFLPKIITGDESWVYGSIVSVDIEILKRLRDAIRCKRPELWRSG